MGVLFHFHENTTVFSHIMMEIPTNAIRMLDVALFWFITKHKGRFDAFKMLAWLH
jgi:hypothetical protein